MFQWKKLLPLKKKKLFLPYVYLYWQEAVVKMETLTDNYLAQSVINSLKKLLTFHHRFTVAHLDFSLTFEPVSATTPRILSVTLTKI